MSIENTLGNEDWLRENESNLKDILPETWTHVENLNILQMGFSFKVIGIDWRSDLEFGKIMVFLEKIGIMVRDGVKIRRRNGSIFK